MNLPLPGAIASWRRAAIGSAALFVSSITVLIGAPNTAELAPLRSPDGRIQAVITLSPAGSSIRPTWSAHFRGKPILSNCTLGLRTEAGGDLLLGARLIRERRSSSDQRVSVPFGKSSQARNRFHEIRCQWETAGKARVDVVFRCYDDAVALRYELPKEAGQPAVVRITDESTSFTIEGEPMAFVQNLENFRTSHEHNVVRTRCEDIRPGALLDLPLTLQWTDNTCVAITEAALRHYAGMCLMRTNGVGAKPVLVSRLTPREDGASVVGTLPLKTPWRVALIGDRPGALLESETLFCLNEPSSIRDTSWIKPGKITFSWWNGDVYDGQPGLPILSFAMAKRYIDFCAANGIPTHSLTSTEKTVTPWYHQSKPGVEPGPDTDVTRPRDGFELASIRRYAESKHVRLWTWVHQGALRGRVEEAFTAFERMGWSGMMVDFFDHDDQDSVEFAESVLEAAARHHILIHLHGIWKPTGLERTYPNLMNHEGALNLEYLKWSDRCTPDHNLLMAFTRLIAGPMDYHLGGFRAVTRAEFKPRNIAPTVLGTRGHHLAMYVCFDNPNPMVADYPTAYEGQIGFEFLQRVPTWWDETRVLEGIIGERLVTARRKGKSWYLGAMSAGQAGDIQLPLAFLKRGEYSARIWKDASDADVNPNHLELETRVVAATDILTLHTATDGGFVIELKPR